jgi:hypothetical protein
MFGVSFDSATLGLSTLCEQPAAVAQTVSTINQGLFVIAESSIGQLVGALLRFVETRSARPFPDTTSCARMVCGPFTVVVISNHPPCAAVDRRIDASSKPCHRGSGEIPGRVQKLANAALRVRSRRAIAALAGWGRVFVRAAALPIRQRRATVRRSPSQELP